MNRPVWCLLAAAALIFPAGWSQAHDAHKMAASSSQVIEAVEIDAPDVELVDRAGKTVSLRNGILDGHRIVLMFQYTQCPQACLSINVIAQALDAQLASTEFSDVRIVSITLDPANDTPEALAAAAEAMGASARWIWLTGDPADLRKAYRAFGVGVGPKESHVPFFLVGAGSAGEYVRKDGLVPPDEIVQLLQHTDKP
jgi:protein SCO1/2